MIKEKKNVIKEKSFEFAKEIVYLYKVLADKREFVLSKQLLRSGTSIGANVRESEHAQSKADFIHKLSISLKEANETEYWLDLLYETNYLTDEEFLNLKNKNIKIETIGAVSPTIPESIKKTAPFPCVLCVGIPVASILSFELIKIGILK